MEHRAVGYLLVSIGCSLATSIGTIMAGGGWTLALMLYPVSGFVVIAAVVGWALVLDQRQDSDAHAEAAEAPPSRDRITTTAPGREHPLRQERRAG